MTTTPPREQLPLRDLTEDERQLLHHNPNTSDLVEFVQAYARDALRAQAASVEPVAFAKDGNLFWRGNPVDHRGENCDLYRTATPAHIPADVEAVTCSRCGHVNHIQEGKAMCQVSPPQAPQAVVEDDLWALLNAVTDDMNKRAAPGHWLTVAYGTGSKFITERRAKLIAAIDAALAAKDHS